jgi:peroxiredoxin
MRNWLLMTFYLLGIISFISCSTSPKDGQVRVYSGIKRVNVLDSAADVDRLLINQKVPLFKAPTLDGVLVDSNYFKRKVTLINFMYIGCAPCMAEAPMLRKLYQDMKSAKFQMLCIAPQTSEQMRQLASYSIPYSIIAECPEEDALGNPSGLGCRELSRKFQVGGYPVILLVDSKGIIRYRHGGFSNEHPPQLKAEIESLLQ